MYFSFSSYRGIFYFQAPYLHFMSISISSIVDFLCCLQIKAGLFHNYLSSCPPTFIRLKGIYSYHELAKMSIFFTTATIDEIIMLVAAKKFAEHPLPMGEGTKTAGDSHF
jgi:hypothetical protein